MKRIMFNDKYGLTKAVLEGRKTMTRRAVPEKLIRAIEGGAPGFAVMESKYKVGEVVAVAQAYKDIEKEINRDGLPLSLKDSILKSPGYRNKMFVLAEDMPHQIRITNIRVERLQDISDEDCLREGIVEYTCNLYEYRGICYSFDGDKTKMGTHKTPREAFAALIDKVAGNGTWASNPWVFVYEFELIK